MRIVVGLGNPGSAYKHTRHNVGFAVVEELARRWRWPLGRTRHGVRVAQGMVDGEPVILVEPQMYMNCTGAALPGVGYAVTSKALIVIHDDLDLECGCVRVKRGGGTAGHHGLDSIVECYDRDFTRVRVGVGRAPRGTETADYLLSKFEIEEGELVSAAVQRAADATECILREGEEAAMNCFNVRTRRGSVAVVAPMGRN